MNLSEKQNEEIYIHASTDLMESSTDYFIWWTGLVGSFRKYEQLMDVLGGHLHFESQNPEIGREPRSFAHCEESTSACKPWTFCRWCGSASCNNARERHHRLQRLVEASFKELSLVIVDIELSDSAKSKLWYGRLLESKFAPKNVFLGKRRKRTWTSRLSESYSKKMPFLNSSIVSKQFKFENTLSRSLDKFWNFFGMNLQDTFLASAVETVLWLAVTHFIFF